MEYIITGIYGSILFVCSILDIKRKALKQYILIIAAILMLAAGFIFSECTIAERCIGIVPGLLFAITGYITRGGIGAADSILIGVIGVGVGITGCISVLTASLTLSGIFALVYIAMNIGKGSCRKKTMPFIPFIFIGFVISEAIKYAAI